MNSRMNFGGGFPISQEGENQIAGSWIPLTPEKPIPARSHPIPVDRFGNQLHRANWQEIGGFSNGYLEETLNHNRPVQNFNSIGGQLSGNGEFYGCEVELAERNDMINQIAGSYAHAINNNRASWNNNNLLENLLAMKNAASLAAANRELRPLPPNLHSQIDGAWRVSGSRSSLLLNHSHYPGSNLPSIGDSFPDLPNQSPFSSSTLQSIGDNLLRIPPLTGFPIPYQPNFNLNSPPRAEADSISRVINSFQLAPVTPDQTKKLENNQLSAILRLSADSRHQEKEKQENLVSSIGKEANQYHCDELFQNIVDSTSAAIATPVTGKKDSDGGDQGIDLNKTPQQKPPKRRKHRPKVIVEGKPKRAPKPATNRSTDSKENPTGKRKYVRRKGLDKSANQLEDVLRKTSNLNAEMSAKSSERVLNYNLETIEDKTQRKENPLGKRKYVRMKGRNESASQPGDETQGKENQSGQRKYVRRKGLNESSNQLADVMSEPTNPNAEMSEKSCKRALKFDLETTRDENQGKKHYQQEMQQRIKRPFNLNLDYYATESCSGTNSVQGRTSAMQVGLQNGLRFENKQTGTKNNLTHSTNQMLTKYIRLLESQVTAAPVATMKDLQMKNLNVIARNTDAGNFEANQNGSKNGYTPIQQHNHGEGIGQLVFQAKTSHENLERMGQLMSQCTPKSVPEILPNSNEVRESKRGYCYTTEQMHPCTVNPVSSSLLCQELLLGDECQINGSSLGSGFSKNHKKERIHDGLYKNTYSSPCVKEVEDDSIHGKRKGSVDVNANECMSEMNHETLNRYFESSKTPKRQNNGISKFTGDWYIHSTAAAHNFPNRYVSAELQSCSERMGLGETGRLTQVHNFVSQAAVENCVMLPPSPPKNAPAPGKHKVLKSCHINVATTKQTVGPTPSKSISTGTDKVLQEQDTLFDYQLSAGKTRGPPGTHKYPIPLDEIISRIKVLNINERSTNIEDQEQKALVPYKENGAVVPYDGFIKKRKPRPKVDLDPETDRIWKLLMGKEVSESDEVTHKKKENWWEEERRVFQGRAESFIARMHLVQGDRRFSQWKGSVVDSVIGVFLTQNVSDHLSSSAFMSLAAKFPIGSKVNNKTCDKDPTTILVDEPEVCILNPDEAIKWHEEVLGRPSYNQQSTSPLASREHQRDSGTPETERTSLGEANSQNVEEEVISSQDSYDPSVEQGDGGIRSYTGSNSEAEEPTPWCQPNKIHGSTSTNFLQTERTNMFQEFYSFLNGSSLFDEGCNLRHKQLEDREHGQQEPTLDGTDNLKGSSTFTCPINSNNLQMCVPVPSRYYQLQKTQASGILEVGDYEVFGEENISSWPSTTSGVTMVKDTNCMSRRFGQIEESVGKNAAQQNGVPRVELCTVLSKHTLHKESISEPEHHIECNQPSCGNHQLERNKTFPLESISGTEPVKYAEAPAERQNSTLQHIPNAHMFTEKAFDVEERISAANKLIKPNSKVQVDFSGKEYDKKTNVSKAKRGNADGEKKNPVDWDSLRKQVQANGGKKERSKETMDSMDYEAMRCADVDEISKAIKERGMNNMLAERIKEFLNRLVREHGSIDLEWLRDVPPEKTKDYLLSVRGLGLKSVECVRLLTLRHLAFPVDTNVGRIAVRLGWVPLQPLPESLQLHLLELYPMLESIQKYLWPRLCKLDQRTLYELHYQMITFGKVFCTKSRPNCNACPMRGECRHFASAFASARLALPGPEEKSVVSSTIPVSAKRNSAAVINPAQLPLLVNRSIKEVGPIIGNNEPIIEEPTTPEQEGEEITESDIEDAYYEDPDEIPTIKLNVEEFTVNLQSYMQENMELQEGDMSKALVALSQEAASIPTPKLKNVSRLRTEHQVYELPDTHPLLKGMDRREPDDPSPYLLAIWTPGETANSIQLPERRCESQKADELCNEKTCFSCNSIREANSETVRGTILIPCRTAMRGSFPLNGTYFQVNEVFADHDSSLNPIDVPRAWIWNLPRRTVYFGTSVSTIFKGLSTEGIQYCFWRGFVCVRGFDQTLRAPRPLMARLHFPASRLAKTKNENK